jgi:pimeloyl-ACP methyl ester carboxylesterase
MMVMGLGGSHRLWGDPLVDGLAAAGYRVILFDNRDVGASFRYEPMGKVRMMWNLLKNTLGLQVSADYTLDDMAADTVGLMDHLQLEKAHILGASMGGMISQIIAANYPEKTLSLISIMSTSGAPHLPKASDNDSCNIEEALDADSDDLAAMHEKGFYPEGVPRQFMAILRAGDRSDQLTGIKAKTLILHGRDDTLLPLPHGEHTAELIPNSEFYVFDNMGHNMPEEVVPLLLSKIVDHVESFEN